MKNKLFANLTFYVTASITAPKGLSSSNALVHNTFPFSAFVSDLLVALQNEVVSKVVAPGPWGLCEMTRTSHERVRRPLTL